MKGVRRIRGRRQPSVVSIVFMMANVLLPFASPFAVGKFTAATSVAQSVSARKTAENIRAAAGVSIESTQQTGAFRRFLASMNPTSGKNDGRWKGGEFNATIPARLLFRYASPLMDLASKRELDEKDVFDVAPKRSMNSRVPQLSSIYNKCRSKARKKIEQQKQQGSDKVKTSESNILARALLIHQRRTLILTGCLRLLNTAVQAFPAILVSRLLRLIEAGEENPISKSLWAAASLVAVLSIKMVTENQYFHRVVQCATQTRGSLAGLIFDKSLRLPSGGEVGSVASNSTKTTSLGAGGIVNLMQSDASVIESTFMQLHTIWDGPLQIAIYTTLLFRYLGPSVLWGIGVLLTIIPLNSVTLRVLNRMRRLENAAKDARTKRTTEAISNMKLLKLQAWESYFGDDIRGHRREQLRRHSSRGIVRALNQAVSNAVPALVLVVTLTAYSKTGRPIVASTIFTAISLFNQLRFPLFFYPMLIDSLVNGGNALQRLSAYLSAEEIVPYTETLPPLEGGGGQIEMKNGNFLWPSSKSSQGNNGSSVPSLCGVELKVKPGEIVAVVGNTGSGKSALVKGLLGELAPVPRALVDQGAPHDQPTETHGILEKPAVVSRGNVAYCSQEAWLPKGTLREAVVFGREYDEDRYLAAIRDAGLDEDMVESLGGSNSESAAKRGVLSHETDVGEGGSSLSGGQRARVALARALYGGDDTKVFLFDDPLAALDASVGATVFERLTRRMRNSKSATVLVTNDPNLPRRCDRVVLMGKTGPATSCSKIVDVGSYDELIARGHNLRSLSVDDTEEREKTNEHGREVVKMRDGANSTESSFIRVLDGIERSPNCTVLSHHADPDGVECMKNMPDFADHEFRVTEDISEDRVLHKATGGNATLAVNEAAPMKQTPQKLMSADDSMSKGAVPFKTYVTYIRSVRKPLLVVAMVLSYMMANGAQFFQQFIVAKWTELGQGDAMAAALGVKYLRSLVYAAGVVSVFLWMRSFLTMRVGVNASEFLHNRMLTSVFSAPMSFFDATPSGQLLSRFGKEMETVDSSLPDGIGSVLFCFLQIFLSGAALAGVITPAMFVPLSFVGMFYVKTMGRFRPAARDLKRTESKSRAPIYTHFGEALRGTETIRSIPSAATFWSSRHRHLTDRNLSVYASVKALDRWLSIRLESLGNTVVFACAVASVFLTRSGKLKAGSAGWGLTQALAITGLMTWAVRVLTDLETYMMSVVRIEEVTDLEPEGTKTMPPAETNAMPKESSAPGEALLSLYTQGAPNVTMAPLNDAALISSGWPWKGHIGFEQVSMRYNPVSPLVLKNVSIDLPPGTTLGIVGRTGSGKSSLLLTLFRLVEIESGGSIKIDGIDIRSVSLRTLRESLSIIPQDPVLFAGTLMYNLDATGKATPADAWAALESASPELAQQFKEAGTGLETYISEGGKNLSSGQRQLICLARALLRKSKILVMDEATSSVDTKTDAQVQETIKREFVEKGVTVLTVAHRLETVLGYEKIAVLGSGELLEYGSPNELLQNPAGELRRLVDADRQNRRKGARTVEAIRVA